MKGKDPKTTKEKLHPLLKANVNPEMVIAKAKMMVPIFSPRAFAMARHSLPTLEDNSEGFVKSNHELSCLRIASKYLTLVLLATLSLNIRRHE